MRESEPGHEDASDQYEAKTATSEDLFEEAKEVLPGGTGGSAPNWDPYPFFVSKAEGSNIWDVDGNDYVDFNLSWGVLAVGHQHPKLTEGLRDQQQKGTMYGLPHEETLDVARALRDRFPIEKVRFTNSGTESTMYASRLARRVTGNDKIVKIEGAYHGVSDQLHMSKRPPLRKAGHPEQPKSVPHGGGLTDEVVENTINVPFNDIEVMDEILSSHRGEVAAVIVEPVMMNAGVIPPEDGYLSDLRTLTNEHNTLLVFDETKTGVKIAPGGAADLYDVKPDLVTLAKAIGGGLPIGAISGKASIMNEIGDEGLFGTFSANPLSIRASKVTLTEILTDDEYNEMERLGDVLFSGYEDIIKDHGLDATVQAVNGVGGPIFTEDSVDNYREWTDVDHEAFHEYWLDMVNQGVIPTSYGADEEANLCVQHTDEDIAHHLEAFKATAARLSSKN